MTRFFESLRRENAAPAQGRRRARGDDAAVRLRTARNTFDLSVLALHKAALDHVDLQDLASIALRANLNRLAERLGADA